MKLDFEGLRELVRRVAEDPSAAGQARRRRLVVAVASVALAAWLASKGRTEKVSKTGEAASKAVNGSKTSAATSVVKKKVPFSDFLRKVEEGKVKMVHLGHDVIEFTLENGKEALTSGSEKVQLYTEPVRIQPGMVEFLHEKKVPFEEIMHVDGPPASIWRSIFMVAVPVIYLGVCALIIKKLYDQTAGGDVGTLSGKSRVSDTSSGPGIRKTIFADVAGVGKARDAVMEVADILKHPQRYSRVGARLPTGILLVGPPGTGKTMLARAMANECGMPFFHCSGSDFVEVYAGRGASRVRNLFSKAAKAAPCVVFFDEIDALGKSRSADFSMNEEREQTLNQLLASMDGFCSEKRIVIMAATNRYDVLDRALVRPGRFDRIIHVEKPDEAGREAILNVHTRHMKLSEDCDLGLVASMCPGFTGAELAMIANEAAIRAARDQREELLTDDFVIALSTHKENTSKTRLGSRNGSDLMGQIFGGLN